MNDKKVLIYSGLISGAIFALSWFMFHLFVADNPDAHWARGEALGYLTMLVALSTVYFGVKHYRDNELGGKITFKTAFMNGMIIVLIASVIYVVSWMIYYSNFMPEFADQYMVSQIEALKAEGLSGEALANQIKEMEEFNESYKNPVVMAGVTFLEVFPVGLIVVILSAFLLKRNGLK